MFLVGIITWWYGQGWQQRFKIIKHRLARTSDFFSIALLAETLFSPYRQISAVTMNGSVGVQLRSFFDKTLSRIVGAVMRTFVIIGGIIVIFIQSILEFVVLVSWVVVPLLPVVGLLLWIVGWVPSWQ